MPGDLRGAHRKPFICANRVRWKKPRANVTQGGQGRPKALGRHHNILTRIARLHAVSEIWRVVRARRDLIPELLHELEALTRGEMVEVYDAVHGIGVERKGGLADVDTTSRGKSGACRNSFSRCGR